MSTLSTYTLVEGRARPLFTPLSRIILPRTIPLYVLNGKVTTVPVVLLFFLSSSRKDLDIYLNRNRT